MMRPIVHLGLISTMMSSVLMMGCSHNQRQTPAYRPIYSVPSIAQKPAPSEMMQQEVVVKENMPETLPAVAQVETQEMVTPASYQSAGGGKEAVKRRTFGDITAHPCFSHAEDYAHLTGKLQYLHIRNTWQLRYASCDEEDKYGGSVTLVETGPMQKFQSGQMVRVEGELADPESRDPSPTYRVRTIVKVDEAK